MSSPNQFSFLPDDYIANKAQARSNTIIACLLIVVAVGLSMAFIDTERAKREAIARNVAAAQRHAEAARPIEQFHQMQAKQKQVTAQAELAGSLMEGVPRSVILAEITNALPGGSSLLELIMSSKVGPPTQSPALRPRTQAQASAVQDSVADGANQNKFDVTLKVTGMTGDDAQVAQFIKTLSNSRHFCDVYLVISDEFQHDKDKVRRFQVNMTLNPHADMDQSALTEARTAAIEIK